MMDLTERMKMKTTPIEDGEPMPVWEGTEEDQFMSSFWGPLEGHTPFMRDSKGMIRRVTEKYNEYLIARNHWEEKYGGFYGN